MVAAQELVNRLYILLPLAYPYNAPIKAVTPPANWTYDNAPNWSADHPECGGNHQSPIHIKTSTSYASAMAPLKFGYYDLPLAGNITIKNNGHSVDFEVPPTLNGRRPFVTGSILHSKYEAVGVHFHWGSTNSKGSEHMIDDRRFDVEMHIVHKNVLYPTLEEATKHVDGLTVLGVMFKGTRDVDRIYPGLNMIFNRLPDLVEMDSNSTLPGGHMTLGHILGDLNTKTFFTYTGSLTTPGCAEAVTWHVFPEPLPIAFENIEKFWNIQDANGDQMTDNYRPLQELNGRVILYRGGSY